MNTLLLIHPYKLHGLWVFDDPKTELVQEPFVDSATAILDRLTAELPNAAAGFTLLFAAQPFPGYQLELHRGREEYGGYWYTCPAYDAEGWLCPALFKYFPQAPERLYAQARAR